MYVSYLVCGGCRGADNYELPTTRRSVTAANGWGAMQEMPLLLLLLLMHHVSQAAWHVLSVHVLDVAIVKSSRIT